jgi:hypothetical protein
MEQSDSAATCERTMSMESSALLAAIRTYFAGERQEMLMILAATIIMTLATASLYWRSRDGFAAGLTLTVLLAAILLASTSVSLLRRDAPLRASIERAAGDRSVAQLRDEAARIATVESRYPNYRYGAVVLAIIAIVLLNLTSRDWLRGVSAGLLLLVVAQVAIDHYSERRAHTYAGALGAWLARTGTE